MSQYVNEWRRVGQYLVHRSSVAASDIVAFAVYEERAGHQTFMTGPDGVWVGSLMSRPLPAIVEKLSGPYRWQMIDGVRRGLREIAYLAIETAYPEARRGIRYEGEVELALGEPRMWDRRVS